MMLTKKAAIMMNVIISFSYFERLNLGGSFLLAETAASTRFSAACQSKMSGSTGTES